MPQLMPGEGRTDVRRGRWWVALGEMALAVVAGLAGASSAAAFQAADKPADQPSKQDLTLETKDGVKLRASYYPGTKGKDTVPVICVHGYKGKRQEYDSLAGYLQTAHGFAVIVPDLRGHGESVDPDKKLEADNLPPAQFINMVTQDLEAVKGHLLKEHNSGKLNIDRLCLVGSELGGTIALAWTAQDWSWPPLLTGKVGQDVKAVALLSPSFSDKGISVQMASNHREVRSKVALYIMMGAGDTKVLNEAKRVGALFERSHNSTPGSPDRDYFFDATLDTKLQGTQLLTEPTLHVNERVGQFFVQRAEQLPLEWKAR